MPEDKHIKHDTEHTGHKSWFRKNILVIALIILFIAVDLGVYFFVYEPRTSNKVTYAATEKEIMQLDAYVMELSFSDSPIGTLVEVDPDAEYIYEVKQGKSAIVSTKIPQNISEHIDGSPKYIVREITPETISIVFEKNKYTKVPDDLFNYRESPFLPDLFALLAAQNQTYLEAVPFYWTNGDDKLIFRERMLAFPTEDRTLTNQSVIIEYAHLIDEGLIYGDQVKKLMLRSLNEDTMGFITENYEARDAIYLDFDNSTWIKDRTDFYNFYLK